MLILTSLKHKLYPFLPELNESITYKFSYHHYVSLSSNLNLKFITSCKFHIVFNLNLSIKEYAILTFQSIRSASGVTSEDLHKSLCDYANFCYVKELNTQEGGRSHSIVLVTNDQRFVIKTINKYEKKFLLYEFLDEYQCRAVNMHSRLARIFGLYKINPSKQYFIIMESVVMDRDNAYIFDVKGSSADRMVQGIDDPLKPPLGIVLKDNNYRLFRKKIVMDSQQKLGLIREIKNDFMLLSSYGVMDYSVLLVFFNDTCTNSRLAFTDKSGQVISIGIIDFFERYGITKKSERNIKKLFHKSSGISAASPSKYYSRIAAFLDEMFTEE